MVISNPLDAFESYSVHYILLACRTTVAAQDFAKENKDVAKATLTAIDNATYLGSPIKYGNSNNDVFLVIDTRRFAQFSIDSLKYDVYVNGLQKGASTSNLAADLSMTITDSVGISFANFMQWLMDVQMETNFDGLVFMLRTVFVGHNADGTTETVQTETIPMHLNKMDIDLNFSKGSYTLEFMPNMNFDVNRYARFVTCSTATSFNTSNGNTLLGLIDSFENRLNEVSSNYYESVQSAIKGSGYNIGGGNYGRKVNYMITLPNNWKKFMMNGASLGAADETEFTKLQKSTDGKTVAPPKVSILEYGAVKDTYVSIQPGVKITDALDTIFRQVPEISLLGNFKSASKTDESVTFYKYIVGLTSDDTTMTVHVDVVEFKVPNLLLKQGKNANAVSKNDDEFFTNVPANPKTGTPAKSVPKNFIEYDYIFTGRNKDILNLDLKIQDFQFLLSSNLRTGAAALIAKNDAGDGSSPVDTASEKPVEVINVRRFDPVVLPQDTTAALKNFSDYANFKKSRAESQEIIKVGQEQTKNLSLFYAMSPTTVALTIRGNPLIMHKFNMGQLGFHSTSSSSAGSKTPSSVEGNANKQKYRDNLEKEILKTNPALKTSGSTFELTKGLSETTYATSPVFAKINIKGPSVDFRTNAEIPGEYTSSVLSDNFYVVFKVTNLIQAGNFTQELELYSHSMFGNQKLDTSKLSNQFGKTIK